MSLYYEYMDFLLEKVQKIGYKYLTDEDKKNLKRISNEEPIEIPKSYFKEPKWNPSPTPLKPNL